MKPHQQSAMEEIIRGDQVQLQIPGVRFCPMDDELVLSYLKPLLAGENVPGINHLVFECDLYGSQEPWQIWDVYKSRRPQDLRKSNDLYFFTKIKRLSSNDKRISRTVGKGTWRGDTAGEAVKCLETGREVGIKKRLTYKSQESAYNGCYTMYEYDLASSELANKKRKKKDYVLCLLRKIHEPKTLTKKRKQPAAKKKTLRGNRNNSDDEEEAASDEDEEQEEHVLDARKRQRTIKSALDDGAVVLDPLTLMEDYVVEAQPLPTEDEGLDAVAAQLEEDLLPAVEDDCLISEEEIQEFADQLGELLPGFEPEWVNSIDFSCEMNNFDFCGNIVDDEYMML